MIFTPLFEHGDEELIALSDSVNWNSHSGNRRGKKGKNLARISGLLSTAALSLVCIAPGKSSGMNLVFHQRVDVSLVDSQKSVAVAANGSTLAEDLVPKRLPTHVFATGSFWYRPIPKDVSLHPNSENFVHEFLRQLNTYYGNAAINAGAWSAPVYIVGPEVRPSTVTQWDCHKPSYHNKQLDEQWQAVPIPSYALPSQDDDAEMAVYQPSTDSLWEFWQARRVNGQWQACWGGRMQHVSKSNGIWPRGYGATATGLPLMGGMITVDELRRGRINHVIGISLVDVEHWNIISWPANRSDGWNPSKLPNRIPEGLRFRLDPDVDVDGLQLHPIAKIIARAAQTYGFVVWDKAGSIALRAEDPKRFTTVGQPNPYADLWQGTPPYAILARFPWNRLQFLPMNYGRP